MDCESAISPRRLAALPWALLCIQCQEAADRDRQERAESLGESLGNAA
jgi:RNA polymerase-binding transcription factor DksA